MKINGKNGQVKVIMLVALLALFSFLASASFNDSSASEQAKEVVNGGPPGNSNALNTPAKPVLAKVFGEDDLGFDKSNRDRWLEEHGHYANIKFKNVVPNQHLTLKVGAKRDNIKGIKFDDQNFVIDLLTCNSYRRTCAFRINGVPTKRLYPFNEFQDNRKHSFDLNQNYKLKINSVQFDYCDGRRFCHLGYEGYHVVTVEVVGK